MALLIHLPLNGNLTNSGTATDATITADGATVNNNGRNGQQCYYFNNTRIVVQSTQLQNIFASTSSPFTFATWICLNIEEVDRSILFGNWNASFFVNWELTANGCQRVCAGGNTTYTTKDDNVQIPKLVWTHIAVTYDGSTTRFYVNGTASASLSGANTLTSKVSSNTFWIGSDYRNDATRLRGKLSDFRIYNTALSQSEIATLAEVTKTVTYKDKLATAATINDFDGRLKSLDNITFSGSVNSDLYHIYPMNDRYMPLDYLESTGTQYINTGYKATATTWVRAYVYFSALFNYNMAFGNWDTFALSLKTDGAVACACGGTSSQALFYGNTGKWYDVIMGRNIVQFGNDTHTIGSTNNTASSGTFILFGASNSSGTVAYSWGGFGKVRIKFLRIYEGTVGDEANSTLKHWYIPCKDYDTESLGVYDLVDNVFLGNNGTGTFTAGAEEIVPHGYNISSGSKITATQIKNYLFSAVTDTKNSIPYLSSLTLPYGQPDATAGNTIKASVFQDAAETTIARVEKNIGAMEAACRSYFSGNVNAWSTNCASNTVGSWSVNCSGNVGSWSVNCGSNAGFWSSNNNFQGFAGMSYGWYGDCYGHAGHGSACHWRTWTWSTNCSKNAVGSWSNNCSKNAVGSWSVNCSRNTASGWGSNAISFSANKTSFTVEGLDFQ